RNSEAKFEKVFTASPDAMMVSRIANGALIEVNEGFEDLVHIPRHEAIGKSTVQLGMWERPDQCDEMFSAALTGGCRNMLIRIRTRDSIAKVGLVSAAAIDVDGEPCILSVVRDVTESRRAAQERARLEDQMSQVRKLEAVGQLAGGIAHDFNNILQAILGFADLAREEAAAGSFAVEHLNKVIESGERARTLTRQLLTFSRRETITPKVLDVLTVIAEFNQILRRVLPANVTLSLFGSSGTP